MDQKTKTSIFIVNKILYSERIQNGSSRELLTMKKRLYLTVLAPLVLCAVTPTSSRKKKLKKIIKTKERRETYFEYLLQQVLNHRLISLHVSVDELESSSCKEVQI